MIEDVQKISDICDALSPSRVEHRDGPLRFMHSRAGTFIAIVDGFSQRYIFENGSWHVSGEARAKVMRRMERAYKKARKIIDEANDISAREYAETVESNNQHVLMVMLDPEAAMRFQQD